jgi:hypothetical protein
MAATFRRRQRRWHRGTGIKPRKNSVATWKVHKTTRKTLGQRSGQGRHHGRSRRRVGLNRKQRYDQVETAITLEWSG